MGDGAEDTMSFEEWMSVFSERFESDLKCFVKDMKWSMKHWFFLNDYRMDKKHEDIGGGWVKNEFTFMDVSEQQTKMPNFFLYVSEQRMHESEQRMHDFMVDKITNMFNEIPCGDAASVHDFMVDEITNMFQEQGIRVNEVKP